MHKGRQYKGERLVYDRTECASIPKGTIGGTLRQHVRVFYLHYEETMQSSCLRLVESCWFLSPWMASSAGKGCNLWMKTTIC